MKRIHKLSVDEHYVRPQMAWEQMKAAQNIGQTVYIYGTTGTGKTSFAAYFLARKQYCYLSVADTDVIKMAEIISEKPEQKIFVIDDLYLVETQEEKNAFEQLIDALSIRKDLWVYYNTSVYDQWCVELQEFLSAVSIVEQFDLSLAQQITKNKDVGKLIQQAQKTGNFLIEIRKKEQSVYELRTPMKYSMRRRLSARYSQDYINELYYSAGNSYEMEGNVREALRMYEMCHNETGISRILIENERGKDFCEWSRKDRELAGSIGKIVTLVLGKYGKGLVNLALAESFFEKGGDDYEVASLAGKGSTFMEACIC